MSLLRASLLPYWAVLLIVLTVATVLLRARRSGPGRGSVPLAGTELLATLPRYRVLRRRRRRWTALLGVGGVVSVCCGIVLSMQPATAHEVAAQPLSRDVMLCLDVSGSMADTDVPAVRELSSLSARLKNERIGLTIFDAAAQSIFPLTDDATYVHDQLAAAAHALTERDITFLTGTVPTSSRASSLVPDGLVSCLQRFDHPELKRARSVVLVTDNEVGQDSIYTLAQAIDLARTRHIRVYAICPTDRLQPSAATQLRTQVLRTRGSFYPARSAATVPAVVRQIQRVDATRLLGAPQLAHQDDPEPWWFGGAAGLLVMLVAAGRLRR